MSPTCYTACRILGSPAGGRYGLLYTGTPGRWSKCTPPLLLRLQFRKDLVSPRGAPCPRADPRTCIAIRDGSTVWPAGEPRQPQGTVCVSETLQWAPSHTCLPRASTRSWGAGSATGSQGLAHSLQVGEWPSLLPEWPQPLVLCGIVFVLREWGLRCFGVNQRDSATDLDTVQGHAPPTCATTPATVQSPVESQMVPPAVLLPSSTRPKPFPNKNSLFPVGCYVIVCVCVCSSFLH